MQHAATINLLSVSRLAAAGHQALLDHVRPALHLSNGTVIPLQHRGGLFWLEGTTTMPLETAMAARPSPMLRHERLGHLNERDMRLIGELDAGEQLTFCEACAIAKSKRKAVARQAN